MKRILVVMTMLALTAQASADDPGKSPTGDDGNKQVWKGVFAGSVALAIGGGVSYWYGTSEIDDSKEKLCTGGAYSHIDSSCPLTGNLTKPQIDELNAQGNRGKTYVYVGAGTILVGTGVAAFAFYKGFIAKDKKESKVVVAPTITRGGAGAALQLSW